MQSSASLPSSQSPQASSHSAFAFSTSSSDIGSASLAIFSSSMRASDGPSALAPPSLTRRTNFSSSSAAASRIASKTPSSSHFYILLQALLFAPLDSLHIKAAPMHVQPWHIMQSSDSLLSLPAFLQASHLLSHSAFISS